MTGYYSLKFCADEMSVILQWRKMREQNVWFQHLTAMKHICNQENQIFEYTVRKTGSLYDDYMIKVH